MGTVLPAAATGGVDSPLPRFCPVFAGCAGGGGGWVSTSALPACSLPFCAVAAASVIRLVVASSSLRFGPYSSLMGQKQTAVCLCGEWERTTQVHPLCTIQIQCVGGMLHMVKICASNALCRGSDSRQVDVLDV